LSGRVWLGLFFLVFGLGFLMQQADLLDFTQILATWWPLILIFIGISQIVNRKHSSMASGLLIIVIGGLFLVNQWFDINLTIYLWPIILIFIGLIFIFSRVKHEKSSHTEQDINTVAFFSGAEIKSQSNDFRGGSVTTVFGGAELDLREAVFSDEGATLALTSVFGGVSIMVPEHIHVEISGVPILGGWEDKTRSYSGQDSHLLLKLNCITICGGVEVKN